MVRKKDLEAEIATLTAELVALKKKDLAGENERLREEIDSLKEDIRAQSVVISQLQVSSSEGGEVSVGAFRQSLPKLLDKTHSATGKSVLVHIGSALRDYVRAETGRWTSQ